ncbi:XdhC family protein [Paracoccus aminophilus]|uniref:Xanthine dehydrogenase/CoxI family protein n=1 Tax=Paracoccus aminophilus JCM 7686 TaxID=1367847 RepID=S5YA71_PARAH|nr:XdhC family protein [Paracoccus aminophilus]AGT08313.1 xanthine dehydrogenase/CoxI family protein [Paracoccus aminophilus JCM 7686]
MIPQTAQILGKLALSEPETAEVAPIAATEGQALTVADGQVADCQVGACLAPLAQSPGVLAIVTAVEGPSYRPLGAVMSFVGEHRFGALSSGCIEADLARHAETALQRAEPRLLRYGAGSPFFDIRLPCGGGLEILLVPCPDPEVLAKALAAHQARLPFALLFDLTEGLIGVETGSDCTGETGALAGNGWRFRVLVRPEPRFLVFGKGPEAMIFAGLARAARFPVELLSHDPETLAEARRAGIDVRAIGTALPELAIDRWTAALLFYHDHDREPPLLRDLLTTPAFYIGAQGSQLARAGRDAELRALGVSEPAMARLRGPIGLIPSTRDPRLLAISVLAEVLSLV